MGPAIAGGRVTQMDGAGAVGLEAGLRVASDRLLTTLDELVELEQRKRGITPGTAAFVDLAGRIETLAASALDQTREQTVLAETTRSVAGTPARVETAIEEIPPRPIDRVLQEWRAAERRLGELEKGSDGYHLAAADVHRLRDEYGRVQEIARRGGMR